MRRLHEPEPAVDPRGEVEHRAVHAVDEQKRAVERLIELREIVRGAVGGTEGAALGEPRKRSPEGQAKSSMWHEATVSVLLLGQRSDREETG